MSNREMNDMKVGQLIKVVNLAGYDDLEYKYFGIVLDIKICKFQSACHLCTIAIPTEIDVMRFRDIEDYYLEIVHENV